MSGGDYVSSDLVKIRDRLSAKGQGSAQAKAPVPESPGSKTAQPSVASEREWKKAVFNRWDEFKNVKADIIKRLAEGVASIPENISRMESDLDLLRKIEGQMAKLLEDLQSLDDTGWNRQNFTSELAKGMKRLENIRIQYTMISSKMPGNLQSESRASVHGFQHGPGIVHELNSLSKAMLFRLGFAFFMPLILGIFCAVALWGAIYYLSLH
ncbi:MAG: hypothetical protein JW808_06700 [Victivallales bacterium]|nr:hypothetical protein [Victivallales bacterium]